MQRRNTLLRLIDHCPAHVDGAKTSSWRDYAPDLLGRRGCVSYEFRTHARI